MISFIATIVILLLCKCTAEIYDPLNVFCGAANCYELLNVTRETNIKDIKKSYRKLSLTHHPDKNRDKDNATEVFRAISKAYEVLTGNESRPLFDYYLDHPKDYFKVSGQHYYRNMPKSDVRIVILVVIGLISWFFHTIQNQKYQQLVKFLKQSVLNNLTLKNGGTKQTIELFKRAEDMYNNKIRELREGGDKNAGKGVKMVKDPLFETVVDQIIKELKIEGGYRKPEWQDLFAVRLVVFPYNFVMWLQKYHRRYHSNQPLSLEDKTEMARDRVGLGTWEELDDEKRQQFIDMEVWKSGVYEEYMKKVEEEEERKMQLMAAKYKKVARRRKGRGVGVGDDMDEDFDYVD